MKFKGNHSFVVKIRLLGSENGTIHVRTAEEQSFPTEEMYLSENPNQVRQAKLGSLKSSKIREQHQRFLNVGSVCVH